MKLYVVARRDLSPGHRAVQGMHALHTLVEQRAYSSDTTLVFLETDALEELHARLAAAGVPVASWGEPYYGEGLTALAAGAEGASHMRGLPLALA